MDEERQEIESTSTVAREKLRAAGARKEWGIPIPASWQSVLLPVLAVFTGLVIGAIVIVITDAAVVATYRNFFRAPGTALSATWRCVATAYGALLHGSLGSPREIYEGVRVYLNTGDNALFLRSIWPITESLVAATPYIFGGLAVALGFRCGLFNIGAEGQLGIGALAAAWVGYSITNLPAVIPSQRLAAQRPDEGAWLSPCYAQHRANRCLTALISSAHPLPCWFLPGSYRRQHRLLVLVQNNPGVRDPHCGCES